MSTITLQYFKTKGSIYKQGEVFIRPLFGLKYVWCDTIIKYIKRILKNTIPPNMIKDNCDIIAIKLHDDLNHSINNSTSPNNLKQAQVTLVHKRKFVMKRTITHL